MGCPSGNCEGYELMADLTFPEEPTDRFNPFWPIGNAPNPFNTVFNGNGHTISGLTGIAGSGHGGLFGVLGGSGVIRNLGVIDPEITVSGEQRGGGGLVGEIRAGGQVSASYVSGGTVRAAGHRVRVGGLAGISAGIIRASYATADIGRTGGVLTGIFYGGLVGRLDTGANIIASYAAGPVTSSGGGSSSIGGLVGRRIADGSTTTNAYYDREATGQNVGIGSQTGHTRIYPPGYDTADLQQPDGYTGIYENWNIDTDGDGEPDNPWDFGGPTDYPALRVISRDSPPPGGPRYAQPPQDTPYDPAADHPEIYTNARYEMSADCAVQPNADGDPESSLITFDLGNYQGAVILHLAIWNGEFFMSYESQDLDLPPFERNGQTATVLVTTDPAQTRFLLDSVSPTTNLVLGYADCHTDDPGAAEPESAESAATSTEATPPPPPKVYVNEHYEMTATCDVANNADGEPESSLITFDLGNYQGDVLLTMSLWNGEWYASYESLDIDPPLLARDGQTASVRVTTNPAETRFLLDGTPNGLRMNLLLGYADCHTAGE